MKSFKEWLIEQREKGVKEIRVPKEYLKKAKEREDLKIDWDVIEVSVWAKKFFEEVEEAYQERRSNESKKEKDS